MNSSPIKVCFIMPKSYPLFNPEIKSIFGGAEVDLYQLSIELAMDSGFDVTFIVADYGQRDIETINGVRVIKSVDFSKGILAGVQAIWKALKKADADIYLMKTASPGVPLVRKYCKKYSRKFIYRTAHYYECDGTYLKKNFISGLGFKWALRHADYIFAQNIDDQKALEKTIGVSSEVVPNGHILPDLSELKKDSILWVGRNVDFKQPAKFIELAKQLQDESFVMICQKATGFEGSYVELKSQADAVPNLTFIERVPFEEVGDYFARAKVLVNTSDYEGFPNTFIQACTWGASILSLNVNPDQFLNKFQCGVDCQGKSERLAEGCRFLLDNNRYIELGLNGRNYVEERHDISKIVEQYKTIFRSLLKQD